MAQVAGGLALEGVEAAAAGGQRGGQVLEGGAVAGHHQARRQGLDQGQRVARGAEAGLALDLGEDDRQPVLPQRITGQQGAGLGLEEQHGVGVVAGGGVHLPGGRPQAHRLARHQGRIDAEGLAELAGVAVAEPVLVPLAHQVGAAGGHPGLQRRVARLQGGVAAAMVRVQVGVEHPAQALARQRVVDQRAPRKLADARPLLDEFGFKRQEATRLNWRPEFMTTTENSAMKTCAKVSQGI